MFGPGTFWDTIGHWIVIVGNDMQPDRGYEVTGKGEMRKVNVRFLVVLKKYPVGSTRLTNEELDDEGKASMSESKYTGA
jgi:hypothetical protein